MSNSRIPLVAAVTLSLCALALPVSGDQIEEGKKGENQSSGAYLALGDSIPFGLNPTIAIDLKKYVGFPKIIGDITEAPVTNASCPFETSGSLLSPSATDPGCNLWSGPLFVSYSGGSQIDFAVNFLLSNKVQLVTIMIGGNDLAQLLYGTCQGDLVCAQRLLPGVLSSVGQNLATAYTRIRATGYKGPIVAVNYYALNANDLTTTAAFQALNQVIANVTAVFGGKVADGFGAFASASSSFNGDACKAGLLIKQAGGIVGGTCNNHPSRFGQIVLAGAVMGVLEDDER